MDDKTGFEGRYELLPTAAALLSAVLAVGVLTLLAFRDQNRLAEELLRLEASRLETLASITLQAPRRIRSLPPGTVLVVDEGAPVPPAGVQWIAESSCRTWSPAFAPIVPKRIELRRRGRLPLLILRREIAPGWRLADTGMPVLQLLERRNVVYPNVAVALVMAALLVSLLISARMLRQRRMERSLLEEISARAEALAAGRFHEAGASSGGNHPPDHSPPAAEALDRLGEASRKLAKIFEEPLKRALEKKGATTPAKPHTGLAAVEQDPAASEYLADIIGNILSNPDFYYPQGGEAREVTVLLSDLRGFTMITETYSAKQVVALLNRYFEKMCEIIFEYGGVVDKFMGDSIMCLFGAPFQRADDVERAVACAVEMQRAMDEFNRENEYLGLPSLYMGIGINTGKVVAGKVGSQLHSEYTVIGDEVNLVSRIETLTLRGQILISENTYAKVKDLVEIKEPILVSVKGKRKPVKLYELTAVRGRWNMEVPAREVRRSLRADVEIPFEFSLCEGKMVLGEVHSGTILNISAGGMFAVTTCPDVEEYLNMRFRISLSKYNHTTDFIYAKILRVREREDGVKEMNVEFTAIQPEDRECIKRLVYEVLGRR